MVKLSVCYKGFDLAQIGSSYCELEIEMDYDDAESCFMDRKAVVIVNLI
uniref:Uncharacterized protein n=1 Tax=Nelumbo nucifera TaxID=4432 RepID=A0A822Z9T6_NELNU|nr:TPA_asm: hypothetical protein HUJ06_014528 [Nelumbo nucifera]